MKNTIEQVRSVNQKKFNHLIDTICRAGGINDSESLHEKALFQVDDVLFGLTYMDTVDPEHMMILADFGPLPLRERYETLRDLLETNFRTCGDEEEPDLWINPDNDHVMLLSRLPLSSTSAKATLNVMSSLVELAKVWRASFFEELTMAGSMSRMLH